VLAAFLALLALCRPRLLCRMSRALPPPALVPKLVDIHRSTGIRFEHLSSSDKKYIAESMAWRGIDD